MKKGQKHLPTPNSTLFSYLLGNSNVAGKKIVDLFAGGGGVSLGIELALGRSPDVAINHDEEAIAMHQHNHPNTRHYRSDVFEVDPREAVGDAPVALLWLSPDCKHHSTAKGGKPLDQNIRSLAWVGLKWAGKVRPDVIVLENVPAFQSWGRLIPQRGTTVLKDGKKVKVVQPWPNQPKRKGKKCRRWKRGMPKQNRPRGPIMHDDQGKIQMVADKRARYQGKSFRRFKSELEKMGYVVEHRVLHADQYGVATIRKRFFLVARCDGQAISWPEPTHGAGLMPVRTAAECIDWAIPTRTIFEQHATRHVDLEPSTLRRVAMGLDRYVLGAAEPFLVQLNHGGHDSRVQSVHQPTVTITGSAGLAVATPFISPMTFDNASVPVDVPLQAITTQGNRHTLVAPQLMHITKFCTGAIGSPAQTPLGTICAGGKTDRPGASSVFGVVAAHLVKHYGGGLDPKYASLPLTGPVGTVTTADHHALVAASLVQYNGTATAQSLDKPAQTLSTVERFALSTAHLMSYYGDKHKDGDARGSALNAPINTVPTGNRHALVTAHVLRNFGTSTARGLNEPLGSQTACVKDGIITTHLGCGLDDQTLKGARRVFTFLAEYCPAALEKVPAEDRAQQLVTLVLNGERYVVWDVGMRMLEPRELYRCQGFPDTYHIDFSLKGKPLSKAAQVRMCGNSVPPPLVSAIIGAQFQEQRQEAAD